MAVTPEDDFDDEMFGSATEDDELLMPAPAIPPAAKTPSPVIDLDMPPWEMAKQKAAPKPRSTYGFNPDIEAAIDDAAGTHGVDPGLMRTFARIESGGDPRKRTGSYKGLFQLSDDEYGRHGGTEDIFDPGSNARAAALKLKSEQAAFEKSYGRTPSASELYFIHQQGQGGADAHWRNPDAPAWENMYRTAEGRQKGPNWAKQAIWGNLPDSEKRRFGSVENLTSRDFTDFWDRRVRELSGQNDPVQVAQSPRQTVVDIDVPPWELAKRKAAPAPTAAELPPWEAAKKAKDGKEPPKGFFDSTFNALISGYHSLVQNVHTLSADAAQRELERLNKLPKKEGWLWDTIRDMNPPEEVEKRKALVEEAKKAAISGIAYRKAEADLYPLHPAAEKMMQAGKGKSADMSGFIDGVVEGFGHFMEAPATVIANIGAQSFPQIVPALFAGAVTRNPYVAATIMGGTSGLSEYSSEIIDAFAEAGIDPTKPDQVSQAFSDPAKMAEIRDKAFRKGAVVGFFDAASVGIASKTLLPKAAFAGSPVMRGAANIGVQMPVQGVMGAAGEGLGSLAAGKEVVPGALMAEFLGEFSSAPFEVASLRKAGKGQPAATPESETPAGGRVELDAAKARVNPAAPRTTPPPLPDEAAPEAPPMSLPDAPEATAPPPSPEEMSVLRRMGYTEVDIRDMEPEQRAAEMEDAKSRGIVPDVPSAEPIADIVAQARDLADPDNQRTGLYLSPDNVRQIQENPEFIDQIAEALRNKGEMVENVDGNGGVLLAKDAATAKAVRAAIESGQDIQQILGQVTGAGQGKPADATAVVQQVTPEGAVTRESAVTQDQVAPTLESFRMDGRDVRAVTPEEALARREQGRTTPPPLPTEQVGDGSRQAPVRVETPEDVARAEQRVAEPTDGQKEAGNYAKGHLKFQGLDITIENPKGSIRRGTSPDGTPWEVSMPATYGYVKRSVGRDGDQVDVYVGPNPKSDRVFVIDQVDPDTGRFDEHKGMLGYNTISGARFDYEQAFSDGRAAERLGGITEMTVAKFKDWLAKGKRTRPLSKLDEKPDAVAEQPTETAAEQADKLPDNLTDAERETLVKAWRYVNAIEQARAQGRDIQQQRLDIANELDTDLASYGIEFDSFPDEQSLREYLGGSRGTDQAGNAVTEAPQAAQAEAPVAEGSGRPGSPPAEVVQREQADRGREGDGAGQRNAQVERPKRYEGDNLTDDDIDTIVEQWKYVREVANRPKPESLAAFVIARGGIKDDAREVRQIAGAAKERPGLINKDGWNLDDIALSAWESGFMGDMAERPTIADFLDRLQDDLHTGTVVRLNDEPLLDDIRIANEIARELADYGVTTNRFRSEATLREYFGQERPAVAGKAARDEEAEPAAEERAGQARPDQDEVILPPDEAPETGPSDSGITTEKSGQTSLVPEATTKEKIAAEAKKKGDRGKSNADLDAGELFNPDAGKQIDLVDMAKAPPASKAGWKEGNRDPDLVMKLDDDGEVIGSVMFDRERQKRNRKEAWAALDGDGNVTGYAPTLGEAKDLVDGKSKADPYTTGKDTARDHVLTNGRKTGTEYGMVVMADGSTKPVTPSERNSKSYLEVSAKTAPDLYDGPAKSADLHHNHPKSSSFSRADYTEAAVRPALRRTWVHGHDGSEYWASFKTNDPVILGKAYDIAMAVTERLTEKGYDLPRYRTHMIATMMRDGGVIEYGATLIPARADERIATLRDKFGEDAIAKAVDDIRNLLGEQDVYDRRPGSARSDRDVGSASARVDEARPEAPGSEAVGERGETQDRGNEGGQVDPLTAIADELRAGGFKTILEARKFAKELGIEGDNKSIDEMIERAVVQAARQIVADGKAPQGTFGALVDLYGNQPNLASRTGTSVANQAYSTPMPLAYLASRLAGVANADTVYEPTAGNGALLIEANPVEQTVHANELDMRRAQALEAQGFEPTTNDGSAVPRLKDIDSVIMNPPFGAVKAGGKSTVFKAGDWSTTQIDHAVALNGLEAMAEDGKAVLILGGTKSEDVKERRKDYRGKAKREFYYRLYNQYNVVDHFTVSGDLYSKQGASWPVDVIVIDGRGKSERELPAANPPAILKSWDQLAEKLPDAAGREELASRPVDKPSRGTPERGTETARDDAGAQPATDRGGSEPAQPRTEGKPGAVRADRDPGQSADVGSRERPDAAQPRSDRDGGRTGDAADPKPIRPRVKRQRKEGASQAAYEPASNAKSLDTLIPVNMADAARNAIERVAQRHGSVDTYVAEQLGYKPGSSEFAAAFSAEQVDALASAIDNVERGAAFIIGDQTGIGKGRIAAGMLRYAMQKGMVPVFVTEKPDLYGDMFRDLRDIGVPEMLGRDVRMFITNAGETVALDEEAVDWKNEYEVAKANGEPLPKRRGQFLVGGTAAKVANGMARIANGEDVADVVFTTYDQMNTVKGQTTARRQFLAQVAPGAMMVFDESHNAGGAAKTGWEKKDATPNRADFARELAAKAKGVMFSSATYAKRPDVMDLYARTDMGKAVDDAKELPELIQRGGVPMQQIVASMLSESGQYMRRERSFDGVEYALEPVPVDHKAYKQFSASMQAIFRFDLAVEEFRKEWGNDALDSRGMAKAKDSGVGGGSANSTSFGALMHNITNQMLLAIKAEQTAQRAIKAHKAGEKPVIALANTNESFIKDFAENEGIEIGQTLDLDFSAVLDRYLKRTLRVTLTHPDGKKKEHLQIPLDDLPTSLRQEFRAAQNLVREGDYQSLPISPIDWIRYRLGEAGMSVKEVTGRQTMIDYSQPAPKYVQRPKAEQGASGKRGSIAYFNSGRLDALILNRSGSTGVSMHASEKFKDRRRRRMILAQAEGNIDTHLQMLGRVHRTGQVIPPAYSQIAAEIPAEARPTAVLMKKMASLNANTTGARSSAFTVESVDFINEVGDKVVADLLIEDSDLNDMLGSPLMFDEKGAPKTEDVARKATGRLVLLDPDVQSRFLDQVQKAYQAEVEQLDALGENPLEAKTVDIQAKTLDTTELKPKQGDSPFLDAVRIEKVSAKAQGRAMPPTEVAAKVAEAIKGTKPDTAIPAALASLETQGRMWAEKERGRVTGLMREQIRSEVAETGPDAKDSTRRRLEAQLERWNATMGIAYPGARVVLGMPAGDLNGIVMSVERTGKAKQMTALGSWTVKIAVPDSMRVIEFPMSKLFPPSAPKSEDEKGATIARAGISHGDLVDQFDAARKEGRETRYVVTGNILGGYDQTRGRGRIVNFTTDDGKIRPGILMGREFEVDKFMDNRRVRFQAGAQIATFLDRVPLTEVTSKAGEITLAVYRGEYRIEMAGSRQKAGQFFTDRDVLKALAPKDFAKRGNKMIVDGLSRAQFVRAVDKLKAIGGTFETNNNQDEAQEIIAGGMREESDQEDFPRVNKDGYVLALPYEKEWGNPRFIKADRERAIARFREIQSINADEAPWADLVDAKRDIEQIITNLFYYKPEAIEQWKEGKGELTFRGEPSSLDLWLYLDELDNGPYWQNRAENGARQSIFSDKNVPADLAEFADEGGQAIDSLLESKRKGLLSLLKYDDETDPVKPKKEKPVGAIGDKMPSGFYFKAARKIDEARETLFQMSGQSVINWLMKEGVSRAEINHFRLWDKFGGTAKFTREEFKQAIAERMFDFRRKMSWLNPERSKRDYELGGTRAFTGPRVPGQGIYFERPIAFPKKLAGGAQFPPGQFESPHWYDVLQNAWASWRGSVRDVPGYGKMLVGEEGQSDYMQGASTGRRPKITEAEWNKHKDDAKTYDKVMSKAYDYVRDATLLIEPHADLIGFLKALAPSHSGVESDFETWLGKLNDLRDRVNPKLNPDGSVPGGLDYRYITKTLRTIDSLEQLRRENERFFAPGGHDAFSVDLTKRTPESPIDENYVRVMARDLLLLAAEKNVDSISVSTSSTTGRIQNNPRAAHFYDQQMKPALERELRKLTGQWDLSLQKVALPKAMGSPKSERPYTVWAAKLEPKTLEKIKQEGVSVFSVTEAPRPKISHYDYVKGRLLLRQPVDLTPQAEQVLSVMRETPSALPGMISEAVVTRITPIRGTKKFAVTARDLNGEEHTFDDTYERFIKTQGQYLLANGRPVVVLSALDFGGDLVQTVRTVRAHEAVHALRFNGFLPGGNRDTGSAWGRLVGHADLLGVLHMSRADLYKRMSDPRQHTASKEVSTFEVYTTVYGNFDRATALELYHQEAVAHMMEVYVAGGWTDQEIAPVKSILDDILSGKTAQWTDVSEMPLSAGLLRSIRDQDVSIMDRVRAIYLQIRYRDEVVLPGNVPGALNARGAVPVSDIEPIDLTDLKVDGTRQKAGAVSESAGKLRRDVLQQIRALRDAKRQLDKEPSSPETRRLAEQIKGHMKRSRDALSALDDIIADEAELVELSIDVAAGNVANDAARDRYSETVARQRKSLFNVIEGGRSDDGSDIIRSIRDVDAPIEIGGDGVLSLQDAIAGQSMRRDLDSLGFYSKALEAARGLKQEKGTPEQMLAQLKKAGVKDAEIEATGLGTLFRDKSGSTTALESDAITLSQNPQQQGDRTASPPRRALLKQISKSEIVKHLEENRVGLREVDRRANRGVPLDMEALDNVSRMYHGEAYADLGAEQQRLMRQELGMEDQSETKWSRHSLDPSNPTYRETRILLSPDHSNRYKAIQAGYLDMDAAAQFADKQIPDFTSGHFPEPNIIGHMMTSMVKHDGKDVYLVDQIQSDWGQKLRDGGVRDEKKIAELRTATDAAKIEYELQLQKEKLLPDYRPMRQKAQSEYKRLEAELATAEASSPGHPLVNTTDQWTQTTLRRAIRQAVEAGAEYIAIPSGETVLSYNPGDRSGMRGFYGGKANPAEADAIDAAKHAPEDIEGDRADAASLRKDIEGIVPKNLRKLLSGIDKATPAPARIDQLETPSGMKGEGFTLFPLTDSVRTSVLEDGQPMFSMVPSAKSAAPANTKAISRDISEAISIITRMTGRDAVQIEFRDQISGLEANPAQLAGSRAAGFDTRTAGGLYKKPTLDAKALITLATNDPAYDLKTAAGHEAFHHVEEVLANPAEKRLLTSDSEMRRMRALASDEFGMSPNDPRLSRLPATEIRAVAFQRYRRMREEGVANASRLHIGIRRFFDKVIQIFQGIRNVLKGYGYDSYEAIFERARTGEMADPVARRASDRPVRTLRNLIDPQMRPEGYVEREPFDLKDVRLVGRTMASVPLEAIRTIQKSVSIGSVRAKLGLPESDDGRPVSVFKYGNTYYVNDGNHRIEAMRINGAKTIRAEIIEIAPKDGNAEVLADRGPADVQAQPVGAQAVAENAPGEEVSTSFGGDLPRGISFERNPSDSGGTYYDLFARNWYGAKNRIGHATVRDLGDRVQVGYIGLELEYQRKGIATAIYGQIERDFGKPLVPDTNLSDLSYSFWMKHRPDAVDGKYEQSEKSGEWLLKEEGGGQLLEQLAAIDGMGAQEYGLSDSDVQASLIPAAARAYTARWLRRLQPSTDAIRVYLQDKVLPIRRQEEAIEAASGIKLPEHLSVYTAEAIYHGRAGERLTDLQDKHVEPLIQHVRQSNISFNELGDYLYARHAIERNDAIRQIDPTNDAGSGMTDAEANGIVGMIEQGSRAQGFKTAAGMIDAMVRDARDTLYRAGNLTKEQYDNWTTKYKSYVPLRGFEGEVEEFGIPRVGRGMDIRGPESMQALGRRSKADNPATYVIQQSVQAIIRSEKNRVDKTLYRLIQAHPDPDVWRVFRGAAKRRINPQTGLVEMYWVPPAFAARNKENVFGVKIAGKQHYMEILHEPLARSLRTAQPGLMGTSVGRAFYGLTRFYAQLVTSFNPEFVISNYLRDLPAALMNVGDVANKPADTRRKIIADALSFKSIRGVMAALQSHEGRTIFGGQRAADENMLGRKRSAAAQDYAKWFEEYRLAGGKISFIEMNDIDRIKNRVEKSISEGKTRRALRNVFDLIDNANSAVENGVRLSAYIALRKNGVSQDKAAFAARELTVNFNRKGEYGPGINAFYLFFNASVQGSTRLAQALTRSPAVRKGAASIVLAGVLIDLLNYSIAGIDDDDENAYEKIEDWKKEKNMIVMLPGRKDYVQIPMPYGYNVLYLFGQKMAALSRTAVGAGKEKPAKAIAGLLGAMVESFSPMGAAPSWLQLASPTLLDPFTQIAENKSWFGGKIAPEKLPTQKHKPDSEMFFSTAPAWAIDLARELNRISGGSTVKPGYVDVSPESIEHIAEFLTGGVGKFIGNIWNTGQRAYNDQEWVPEKTPFLRRVYGKATSESRRRDFYEKWNEVDAAHFQLETYRKAKDFEGMKRVREETPAELAAYEAMRNAQRQVSALRKQGDVINLNRDLDAVEKEKRLKLLTERENEIILRALKTYARLKKEKSTPAKPQEDDQQ